MIINNLGKRVVVIFLGLLLLLFSCRNKAASGSDTTVNISDNKSDIKLSDAQIQLANIIMADVAEGSLSRQITLTGVLQSDEQSVLSITARLPGRIQKLYCRNTGETVKKGDKLYEFYSDELINAQREYLTLQSNNWNFSGKYEPSLVLKDKLLVMGLVPEQINQLEKDGKIIPIVTIFSPADGKVKTVNVSEGQYVDKAQSLFELVKDDKLWVDALVYPGDLPYLRQGMPVTITIRGEAPVLSRISSINPSSQPGNEAVSARAEIKYPKGRFLPGMQAFMIVNTRKEQGLIIPYSALISGPDGECVWIRDNTGYFSVRTVTTGTRSDDSVLVLSGLEKTDQIVCSGAYLLNSELVIKQGTARESEHLPEFSIGKAESRKN